MLDKEVPGALGIDPECNATAKDPNHTEVTQQLMEQVYTHTSEIGSLPWLAGGDWDIEPDRLKVCWEMGRAPASLSDMRRCCGLNAN